MLRELSGGCSPLIGGVLFGLPRGPRLLVGVIPLAGVVFPVALGFSGPHGLFHALACGEDGSKGHFNERLRNGELHDGVSLILNN